MIVESLFMIISFCMIWGAWGFWALVAAIAGKLILNWVGKREYYSQMNWGGLVGNFIIILLGLCAVNAIWASPQITALAIATVIICFVVVLKS